jgi:D-alanyl-lipoteichoic acid acyltransferase DltB (MBOAT superfamily)
MLFASFPYLLVFLPLVVLVCIGVQRWLGVRAAQVFVLAASVVFYCWSKPSNLVFLGASILANWLFAHWIERAEAANKKRALVTGLTLNVLYLCVFKYLGFLASTFSFLLPHGFVAPILPFPLGISFFTVTQIMYLVDCYEGALEAGTLLDHTSFVAFFPYVISGPLGRSKRMRHQFGNFGGKDGDRTAMLSRGLFHFSMGLFKKAVFADSFARVANFGYNSAHSMSAVEAWVFSGAYALQLYFDFSGYSDMAIGSAMMLGIDIPRNFDAPYSAKSIIDFWQRWHISLTSFITSYLYTPILRAFKKRPALAGNMLFTSGLATFLAMGIAGLWHGAAWTFVIYGFLHGTYLAINQYWRKKKMPRIPAFPSWLITFAGVVIADMFFGASSIHQATERIGNMFNPHHVLRLDNIALMSIEGISLHIFGLPLVIGTFVAFFGPSAEQRARDFRPTAWNCALTVVLFLVAVVFINSSIPTPFVYFRF